MAPPSLLEAIPLSSHFGKKELQARGEGSRKLAMCAEAAEARVKIARMTLTVIANWIIGE